MADTDSVNTEQIRSMSSAPPRPPFQPSQQMRPQMGPPAPGSPSPRQPPPQVQGMSNQQRPIPPPLRRVDSKGNTLLNPGQPPRPGPQQMNPQARPPPPPNVGPLSPPGQGTPRPQGAFPWSGGGGPPNRPPNSFGNQPPTQGGRPFPRPGIGPGGQPQFRPPYPQQNIQHQPQQQQQQQQQHHQGLQQQQLHQQQQQQQQQQFHQPQHRPLAPHATAQPSNPVTRPNNYDNDDDSDVVFGQAVTPLKTPSGITSPIRTDQMPHEIKTAPHVMQHADNSAYPKNHSFGESNGNEYLKDIEEELPYSNTAQYHPTNEEKIKMNEPVFRASEPSSNSTKLTNFQKVSGDVPEKQKKVENPMKMEKPQQKMGKVEKPDLTLYKGDNDSGVDESTQEKERNGPTSPSSPAKTPTKPTSGISRPPSATPSNKSTKSRSASRSRLAVKTPEPESTKKVPMNKVQVGNAPSPNLKAVRSKIGSLDNATYKPGGGKIKIESKKIEIKAAPRIEAKNEKYTPKGGDKKIVSTKLQWNAKSKIGSLENANHKPGGGDKKIDTIKAEFKDKAKAKVGSKDNVKHAPGGGDIKKDDSPKDIQTHKLEIKAQSKVGSLDNVKHKPGGGDKKIYDDKDYLKNVEHPVALTSPSQSPPPSSMTTSTTGADENLNQQQQQQQQQQPA